VAARDDSYRDRLRTPDEAAALVRDVDDVLLPLAPAQPSGLLHALARRERFVELRLLGGLLQEPYEVLTRPGVRMLSGFFGVAERALRAAGVPIEHVSVDFHGIALLVRRMRPRVVATTVSPPDGEGYLSFGLHAGASAEALRDAGRDPERLAIAEVNPHMPRTRGLDELGGNRIHCSEVDVILEHDQPMLALPDTAPGAVDRTIAAHVGELVRDGATLQFGIGGVPNEVAKLLAAGPRGDFGIHTELLVDGVKLLHEAGKVSNRKGSYDGFSICTFALGTQALYDWAGREAAVRFLPVIEVNLPSVIKRNRRMVSINGAIMIDLRGQVVADTIAGRQYSGVGGHEAFVSGAREAEDGMSILCVHSTAEVAGERRSRIVAELPPGSIVTTPRHQVQWVATEHGAVDLSGLSDGERARALTGIAAPAFRDQLAAAADELARR
jgi:acyl-CoA hydrolase